MGVSKGKISKGNKMALLLVPKVMLATIPPRSDRVAVPIPIQKRNPGSVFKGRSNMIATGKAAISKGKPVINQ